MQPLDHDTGMTDSGLILASASPRRAALLKQIGLCFDIMPADIDETRAPAESAQALVERLAASKARAVAQTHPDAVVLGADTVVALGEQVFGKPRDEADAARMLEALSGRTHRVCTAVAVIRNGQCQSRLSVSRVTFATLDATTIANYWATGEPRGKAGAYAIQGFGGAFVHHLEGSYSGVMGLPLQDTASLLASVGVPLPVFPAA